MRELKDCPFCGCDQIQYREDPHSVFYRYCRNCHARGPFAYTYEDAEVSWDERFGDEDHLKGEEDESRNKRRW